MDEPKLNFSEEESDNESIADVNNEEDEEYDDAAESESIQSDVADDEKEEEEDDLDEDGENNTDDEDIDNEEEDVENDSQQNDEIESDSDDEEEQYLFDDDIKENLVQNNHPLLKVNNMNEIRTLSIVTRDDNFNVVDEHHKTIPILTKYERAKVLGIRANQINNGCKSFVEITESDIDGYLIAERELNEKKMPLIIKRPLPSGKNEYWKVNDLELIM
jgi:DNA-directed RNA polymerase I, II, and III subunit RPABC2